MNPIKALAEAVLEAEQKVERLRKAALDGYPVNPETYLAAMTAEDYARQAFATATGHSLGTQAFQQALRAAQTGSEGNPDDTRTLLVRTANAIANTIETCAPLSARESGNPGWAALRDLERCRDQIASILTGEPA